MNFKAGDHALLVGGACVRTGAVKAGTEIEITSKTNSGYYFDALDGSHNCWEPESSFELIERTAMEDIQKDDIIIDPEGDERKVYGRAGDIIFVDDGANDERYDADIYHVKRLTRDGWTFKTEEDVTEMTVAEVEKELGKKVKIVKG